METENSSNTGPKQERKPGTFVKGDPRINRKGRPRSFDQLRELAQGIAHELLPNGMTVSDAILRIWSRSKDLAAQKAFMEYAFGKVPDKIEGELITQKSITLYYDHERPERNGHSRLPSEISSGAN